MVFRYISLSNILLFVHVFFSKVDDVLIDFRYSNIRALGINLHSSPVRDPNCQMGFFFSSINLTSLMLTQFVLTATYVSINLV